MNAYVVIGACSGTKGAVGIGALRQMGNGEAKRVTEGLLRGTEKKGTNPALSRLAQLDMIEERLEPTAVGVQLLVISVHSPTSHPYLQDWRWISS